MYWRVGRLQWCWAHLKRDFQALIDSGDNQAKRLGYDLRRMTCNLFEHWANYRDGTISRTAFIRRMAPVRRTEKQWRTAAWRIPARGTVRATSCSMSLQRSPFQTLGREMHLGKMVGCVRLDRFQAHCSPDGPDAGLVNT